MKAIFDQIVHCARPYVWILIIINSIVTGFASGLAFADALILGLCLSFLSSFGFILNDIQDREMDKELHSDRLAFADTRTLLFAHISMWMFLILALVVAYYISNVALVVAFSIAVGLAAYSLVFRRQLLIATLVCSASITSPLWAPYLVADSFMPPFHLAIVCVSFTLLAARETILDVKDVHGDIYGKRETIATVMGEQVAVTAATVLTVTASLSLLAMWASRILTLSPFVVIIIVVALSSFLWLVVTPTIRLYTAENRDKPLFNNFVQNTRRAMVLIPLFILVDWLTRA